MVRIYELRQKEVINIRDGSRFGFISDVEIDMEEGFVTKIIIPGPGKILGMFGREQEYHVPWKCIRQIGDDIILIDIETHKALVDCEF